LLSWFYGHLADEHACGSEFWASIQEKTDILHWLNTHVLERLKMGDSYDEEADLDDCEGEEPEVA